MGTKNLDLPRGLRNNNPLNLRRGYAWKGAAATQDDPAFLKFDCMEMGVRAAFVTLRTYIKIHKLDTVRGIVGRWAPPTENNTQRYLGMVVLWSGISPDTKLKFEDRTSMVCLFQAMCKVENGDSLPAEVVYKGYDLVDF